MANSVSRNSYGNILKAFSLFGGVKVIQIIIGILRSKLIALLIGPSGMGISSLLTSTTFVVNRITGCGLQTSAVRDVAKAYNDQNQERINTTITTLRGLTFCTGLIGAVIVFLFAAPLSSFAFGNLEYVSAFRILSIMMLFMQINVGQIALLQGCFRYKDMAKATLTGQVLSLVLTIPLYYLFREKGIVPALLIASLITVLLSTFYAVRVPYQRISMSLREFWRNGKGMLSLGIVIAIGGQISNASSYLINIFISHVGSIEAVGYYAAAMTMANSYVFLVLSAMTTDYVPRLSALLGNDKEQIVVINKQMAIVMIIITPILILLTVFAKEALYILYSSDFYVVTHMLELLMVAMFFRAISWCLSYAFIARGDSKTFLINECLIFILSLSLKFLGFYFYSYTGIGVALVLIYFIYSLMMLYVCKKCFNFELDRDFFIVCRPCLLLCTLALIVSYFGEEHWWKYVVGMIVLCLSLWRSYLELEKRVHIKEALLLRLKKHEA